MADRRRPSRPASRPTPGSPLLSPVALMAGAVLLVVLGLAVGVLLGRSASDPAPAVAGREVPGGPPPAGPPLAGSGVALAALRAAAAADDAPTTTLLAYAHLALDEGQVAAATSAYERVLARDARNVEAITHLALILYQGNRIDEALARIDRALEVEPRYAHALWDRAQMLLVGKRDYAAAVPALQAFLAVMPTGEDADRARAMLAEAERLGGRPAGAGSGAPPPRRGAGTR